MQPKANKTILTASFIETTSAPSGVSKVTKSKFLKSEPIKDMYTGLSSTSLALMTPEVLGEVTRILINRFNVIDLI